MEERLTVQDAARLLGTTDSAIRKRIARGTLKSERDEEGRVYVYIPPGAHGEDAATGTTQTGHDLPTGALFDQMSERIAYLERQVEEEREARRRADTLLARMMDRLPELEPPREPGQEDAGTTQTPADVAGRANIREDAGSPQEDTSRRSWWKRLLDIE